MSQIALYVDQPNVEIVTGVCPHDCPDTCSWQVAVDRTSGRALDLWGHADHPVTQGKLCGKVDRYLERTYHRDRLVTPLKRIGPKGSGQFTPVSWEEAFAAIAKNLQRVIAEDGAEAVLPYSYAGTMGLLQGEGVSSRFFGKLGASRLARTICSDPGFEGYRYTVGASEGMETESFAQARLILIWGSNTLTSNLHLWPFIQAARKQGARVIVIDPAQTRTAKAADEWIPLHPGTDGALALALMHEIIQAGLYDTGYVEHYTVGFAALAERVVEWTPERAAAITGIPSERIRQLARAYATIRPAAIRINYGLQRHRGGGMAVRTIACLPALVGAWRDYGGGIQLSTSGTFRHLDTREFYGVDLLTDDPGARLPRILNMVNLGDALSLDPARIARAHYHPRPVDAIPSPEQAGPPVKALIVYNSNPAAIAPDQSAVLAGLRREDLFTVVLEHFQTDTVDYADYVLPATTQLEHWDLHRTYGHIFLALNRPAIAPVGQSLPNSEIFRRLAQAMGYTEPCFAESDETLLRNLMQRQRHQRYAGVTWEKLLQDGFARLNVPSPYLPFAQGNFPTPSGKCEFYSERMKQHGYDPLPTYTAPRWQETGDQGVETGDRRVETGDRRVETRDQGVETRDQRLETGDRRVETRDQRPEIRDQGVETRRQKTEDKGQGIETKDGTTEQIVSGLQSLVSRQSPVFSLQSPVSGLKSLICISPPAHSFLNSTFANLERFQAREEQPLLQIHPEDAEPRGIATGDAVTVGNELGNVTLTAEVIEGIIPGTVLAPGVWWSKFSPDGRNINQVVSQGLTDMGGGAVFYDTQVWVELVKS